MEEFKNLQIFCVKLSLLYETYYVVSILEDYYLQEGLPSLSNILHVDLQFIFCTQCSKTVFGLAVYVVKKNSLSVLVFDPLAKVNKIHFNSIYPRFLQHQVCFYTILKKSFKH